MGFIFLMLSGLADWGYSYRADRRVDGLPSGDASAILNRRYAAGELSHPQYLELKLDIAASRAASGEA